MAQPALRALASAGHTHPNQFTQINAEDLARLHGMGPKGIEIIRAALQERGQSFLA
ncbi:MAG: DNA-binding protein [Chloroflexi bacterium]|nr:DNA-binding protein [Chloroflexota bacterium]